MTNPSLEPLHRLAAWFTSQCDGQWEHGAGISINSLDNPGWSVHINIADTALYNRAFTQTRNETTDPNDWYICQVKDHQFEAVCGPLLLAKVLEIFLDWAEASLSGILCEGS